MLTPQSSLEIPYLSVEPSCLVTDDFTWKVKLPVLKHLMEAAGWLYPGLLLFSCILYASVQCVTQLWLSDWSNDKLVNGTQDQKLVNIRLGVYGGLAGLQSVILSFIVYANQTLPARWQPIFVL